MKQDLYITEDDWIAIAPVLAKLALKELTRDGLVKKKKNGVFKLTAKGRQIDELPDPEEGDYFAKIVWIRG